MDAMDASQASRRASRLALSLSRRLLSALRSESAMTRSLSTANPTARFKQGFLRVLNFGLRLIDYKAHSACCLVVFSAFFFYDPKSPNSTGTASATRINKSK
jgi:hypothetical protein